MADWTQPQAGITAAVAALMPGGNIIVRRESPEVRMQFTAMLDGATLRAEVCNETAVADERLSGRGWELVDEWSGVWRRTLTLPASAQDVAKLVGEALHVVRGMWGHPRSDSFAYLAWREVPERPWWQFWKPTGEVALKLPELGLPQGKEPDPNS